MNDLLTEEEFSSRPYNPKKWFLYFYLGGIFLTSLIPFAEYLFSIQITDISTLLALVLLFLVPLLLSIVMIFLKKEINSGLTLKNAALKIAVLNFCCAITMICFLAAKAVVENRPVNQSDIAGILVFICFYLIIYVIMIAIILPTLKRSQKVNNPLS